MDIWIYNVTCLKLFLLFGVIVAGNVVIVAGALGTKKPTTDGSAANITVLEGRTAILECYIDTLGSYKVGWIRNETHLLTIAENLITDDTRFSIERPNVGHWNLHIRNVTQRDHGEYICRINTDPLTSKYVNLYVAVTARIQKDVSSNDQALREGDTLILKCKASGIPKPDIKWMKDWYPDWIGDTLKIENITRRNGGTYICSASNEYSYTTRKIHVSVVFAPEIHLAPKEIGQTIGGKVYLECRISAVPTPRVYWLKDNVSLESADDEIYKVRLMEDFPDYGVSTISISMSNLQLEHFGVYTCFAENTVGNASYSAYIYAVNTNIHTNQSDTTNSNFTDTANSRFTDTTNSSFTDTTNSSSTDTTNKSSNTSASAAPEVISLAKRIGQYLGGEVVLECEITGASRENMYWLKDNITLEFFEDEYFKEYTLDYATEEEYLRLKIWNIRRSQYGEYKCCAENSFGKSSETVVVYEVPSDLNGNIVKSTAITNSTEKSGDAPKVSLLAKAIGQLKGHDVILTCTIVANPRANKHWMKDNETLVTSLDNNSYQEEMHSDGHVTKLTLKLIRVRDCQFGIYSCHAENTLGNDFDTVLVYDYSNFKGLPLQENYMKSIDVQEHVSGVATNELPWLHTMFIIATVLLTKFLV